MATRSIIKVSVLDYQNQPIRNATVAVKSEKGSVKMKFDPYSEAYIATEFTPGVYEISLSVRSLEGQKRRLFISSGGCDELFILGKEGMPYYFRGVVRVPFEPITNRFGVVIADPDSGKVHELASVLAKKFKLIQGKMHENYIQNGMVVFEYPSNLSESAKTKLHQTIKKQRGIFKAAPVLKQSDKNVTLLTDEIIVRFKGSIEKREVQAIARKFDLRILRSIPYAGNAYQFRVQKEDTRASLDICRQLVEMGVVEYAEPVLYHTFEDDAITPNNFLYPEQWDHPLIQTPDAWQILNDHLGAVRRFGDPDVYLAVVDSGVNTTHPLFSGNVSNGMPKLVTAFNFSAMVPNNNSLASSHGSCCASASVGYTATSSVAGGVPDGTVGIAGNCRLMAVRRGGTEADYSDMYVWVGGGNPNSTRPGFPAQLPRGADIITSSFGSGFASPISGIMKDAIDFLTTYGRGGKGVIMTFSVGNYFTNSNFHASRPWAAYEKTSACGASSLANNGTDEIISAYSGSGTLLDFCAPSHDAYVGGLPAHNPPVNYGAITGTVQNGVSDNDGNMPRNRERQTTLSAQANSGATTVTVASAVGMVNGQAIFIGNPSPNISTSEARRITNIAGNTITFTPSLNRNHANGTTVLYGNRDYRSNFGGTSYSTPVCAGIAALMLSVNNRLTWVEVREIMRETADKIDPNNTDPTGRWRDSANRISTDPGYTGPFFSQYYGYGRVNAEAAVNAARIYASTRDIHIRDNMADTGATTSGSPHWTGVDIWVRNNNDGVAPAGYATSAESVHQSPSAGQSNYLNVRYRNRGTATSYPFYIRAYITHFAGMEFIYPDHFIPTVRPNGVIPSPLTPGTYLIGEEQVNSVAAGNEGFVTMEWTSDLIPPQSVTVGGITVNWHPCILVEVSPHDGFVATGNHVWDDNNLAQKNISIVYPDSSPDDASMVIVGHAVPGKMKLLTILVDPVPRVKYPYFIYFPDPKIREYFLSYAADKIPGSKVGRYREASVLWLSAGRRVRFSIPNLGFTPMIIGLGKNVRIKKDFDFNILQYRGRRVSGSYGIGFRH